MPNECAHPSLGSWLFPQIDAAVHHGGAGTTGASLRGTPSGFRNGELTLSRFSVGVRSRYSYYYKAMVWGSILLGIAGTAAGGKCSDSNDLR